MYVCVVSVVGEYVCVVLVSDYQLIQLVLLLLILIILRSSAILHGVYRPGRINLKLYLGYVEWEGVKEMVKHYFGGYAGEPLTASQLTGLCLCLCPCPCPCPCPCLCL